ncbi:hypothetical protein HY633_02590 [Candidatus Uhrbacteria bacterium]|nr:hypothetical protein [Candidatus Uhrbacteria bacterium]
MPNSEPTIGEVLEFLRDHMVTKADAMSFATKDDLKSFVTKDDLKSFATKDDLKSFATKDDLKELTKDLTAQISKVGAKVDGLAKLNETHNHEIAALRSRDEWHDLRISAVENNLGMKTSS